MPYKVEIKPSKKHKWREYRDVHPFKGTLLKPERFNTKKEGNAEIRHIKSDLGFLLEKKELPVGYRLTKASKLKNTIKRKKRRTIFKRKITFIRKKRKTKRKKK